MAQTNVLLVVSALTLSAATAPCEAVVLYQETGTITPRPIGKDFPIGSTAPGAYRLTFSVDRAASVSGEVQLRNFYPDCYLGANGPICVGNYTDTFGDLKRLSDRAVAIEFRLRTPEQPCVVIPGPGSGYCTYFQGTQILRNNFFASDGTGADLTYRYVAESIPEPSGWALMIGGFGLTGYSVRRMKRARLVPRVML